MIWGASRVLGSVMARAGVNAPTFDLLVLLFTFAGLFVILWTVWQVRAPIATLIRGEGQHSAIVAGSPSSGR